MIQNQTLPATPGWRVSGIRNFAKQFINHRTVTVVMGAFALASAIALFTGHDMAACALGMGALLALAFDDPATDSETKTTSNNQH